MDFQGRGSGFAAMERINDLVTACPSSRSGPFTRQIGWDLGPFGKRFSVLVFLGNGEIGDLWIWPFRRRDLNP